jgi:hypothetical protein
MPGKVFLYRGQVPAGGYRWVSARPADAAPGSGPQRFLVPLATGPGGEPERTYDLLELDVVLFRVFAATPPTPEGVLTFANTYGSLGPGVPIVPSAKDAPAVGPGPRGEYFPDWQRQISDMLQLTTLWDLLRAGDKDRLARHVLWEKGRVRFRSHAATTEGEGGGPSALGHNKTHAVIAPVGEGPGLPGGFEPGDVLRPARAYLQQRLDQQLQRHAGGTSPRLAWGTARGDLSLRFAAADLGAALWLQLADAVANGRAFDRCRTCEKWFEVSPDTARSHRRFCSDACRVKAYRGRQGLARRLYHEEGKGLEEIAEELDSRVATVRRWIMGA